MVTAAPDEVPPNLVDQLAVGGTLVVPVGGLLQTLRVLRQSPGGMVEEASLPVRFVPMVRARPYTGAGKRPGLPSPSECIYQREWDLRQSVRSDVHINVVILLFGGWLSQATNLPPAPGKPSPTRPPPLS